MSTIQRKMTLVDGAPSSPRDETARNSIRPNTTGIGRASRNKGGVGREKTKSAGQSSLGWLLSEDDRLWVGFSYSSGKSVRKRKEGEGELLPLLIISPLLSLPWGVGTKGAGA